MNLKVVSLRRPIILQAVRPGAGTYYTVGANALLVGDLSRTSDGNYSAKAFKAYVKDRDRISEHDLGSFKRSYDDIIEEKRTSVKLTEVKTILMAPDNRIPVLLQINHDIIDVVSDYTDDA